MNLALDLSNYTTNVPVPGSGAAGGKIEPEHVACWRETGYHHAIIGTQWPKVFEQQAKVCLDGGMTIDAYSWLGWKRDLGLYLNERNSLVNHYPLTTHWLDAEEAISPFAPAQIVEKIQMSLDIVDPYKVAGIYTAAWWWPSNTNNSKQFSNRRLWHAAYPWPREGYKPTDEEIARLKMPTVQYGGWSTPTIWQFAGSVQHCATNQDLNLVIDGYLNTPVEEDEMIRFNAIARPASNPDFWMGKRLPDVDAVQLINARGDLGLPEGAKRVWLDVCLREGMADILDGSSLAVAGFVGGSAAMRNTIEVHLDGNGYCAIRPLPSCVVEFIGTVGYAN